jgi:hypothetical protein
MSAFFVRTDRWRSAFQQSAHATLVASGFPGTRQLVQTPAPFNAQY